MNSRDHDLFDTIDRALGVLLEPFNFKRISDPAVGIYYRSENVNFDKVTHFALHQSELIVSVGSYAEQEELKQRPDTIISVDLADPKSLQTLVEELTERLINYLPEYSCSIPTGTTIGKLWSCNQNAYQPGEKLPPDWIICEYVPDPDPTMVGIKRRRPKTYAEIAECASPPKNSNGNGNNTPKA